MNLKLVIAGIAVVLAAIAGIVYFSFISYATIGNLNVYSGSADILRGSSRVSGATGAPIKIGDKISVASHSRISIILKDNSVIRLEGGSEASVADLSYEGGKIKNAVFALTIGRLWSHVAPVSSGGNFAVETPTTVAAVRGTAFSLSYRNLQTELFVASRTVRFALASDRRNEKQVSSGELFVVNDASLASDFLKGPVAAPASYFDDWVNFNEAEDVKLGETREAQIPSAVSITSMATTSTPTVNPTLTIPTRLSPPSPPVPPVPSTSSATPAQPSQSDQSKPPPAKTVVSISLTAAATTVVQNNPLPLKAVAAYSDQSTEDITDKATWKQSPTLGLVDNLGNFHGFNAGQTVLTAEFGGVASNGVSVTVTAAKTLSRLGISYQKNQPGQYAAYQSPPTAQFSATAYWSDGTAEDVTWKTSWSVVAGGSAKGNISVSGLYTAGASGGQDTIVAQFNGASASTSLQVP